MWVFLPTCHVSIVQHEEKPDMLLVRARTEDDLRHFLSPDGLNEVQRNAIPEIELNENADYYARVTMDKIFCASILFKHTESINYTNHKAQVKGRVRRNLYYAVYERVRTLNAFNAQPECARCGGKHSSAVCPMMNDGE